MGCGMNEGNPTPRASTRWHILFAVTLGAFLSLVALEVLTRPSHVDALPDAAPEQALPVPETPQPGVTAAPAVSGDVTAAPSAEHASRSPREHYRLSIVIKNSFFTTFSADEQIALIAAETGIKKLADRLSAHVARNLVWRLDMRKEIYPNDVLDLLFRVVPPEEQRSRADLPDEIELLALHYRSVRLGRELKIYRFQAADWPFPAYYYADGTRVEPLMKNAPLKEWIQITSLLRDRRPRHDGIDFKAPVGTPVYAPWGGTVERINWKVRYNGYSIAARLDTNPPVEMIMLHLDKVHVKPGQRFAAGAHIADVGNTGRSFAPHLHYQLQRPGGGRGSLIDPFRYHPTVVGSLPATDRSSFRRTVEEYDRLLAGDDAVGS